MPDELAVTITTFEHLVSPSGGDYLSVILVLADQEIGGSPDIAIVNHPGSLRWVRFASLRSEDRRPPKCATDELPGSC